MDINELILGFKVRKIKHPREAELFIRALSNNDICSVFTRYQWIGVVKQDPFFAAKFSEEMYTAIFRALASKLENMPRNGDLVKIITHMLQFQSLNTDHYGRNGVRLGLDKKILIQLLTILCEDPMMVLFQYIEYFKLFGIIKALDCIDDVVDLHSEEMRPSFRHFLINTYWSQMSSEKILSLIEAQPAEQQAKHLIDNDETKKYREHLLGDMRYYFELLNNSKDQISGFDMADILIDARRCGLYGRLFHAQISELLMPLLEHCHNSGASMDLLLPSRDYYLENVHKNPVLVGKLIYKIIEIYAPDQLPSHQIIQMKHGKEGLLAYFKELRSKEERQIFLDQANDKMTSLGAVFYAWRSTYNLRPFFRRERVIERLVKEAEGLGVFPGTKDVEICGVSLSTNSIMPSAPEDGEGEMAVATCRVCT